MTNNSGRIEGGTEQAALIRLLGFIVFFSVLNGTMFNVSVPAIAAEFGLMPSEVSWVLSAYIITFALGSITYGKLADIMPLKSLITFGLVTLNVGSLVGVLSMWYPLLVAARAVQAVGGSAIPALSMIICTQRFPLSMKGRALGVIASTVAFSGGVGPILGGFITGTFHWRYLFLFPIVTLFTIPSFRRLLNEPEQRPRGGFDLPGALLTGGGLAALLFSVTQASWPFLALAVILLAGAAFHIKRARDPFIAPSLLAIKAYRNTLITTGLAIGTVFGLLFMTPIMLKEINGLGAGGIGLVLFPGAMCAALAGRTGGRLADSIGGVRVAYRGFALLIAGFVLLSTFAGMSPYVIAVMMVLCYAGFVFLQSSLAHAASNTLPAESTGIGMGIYNMCVFMSGAFSASIMGRLLDLRTAGFCLNPVAPCGGRPEAALYSNLYLLLAASAALAALILRVAHGRQPRDFKTEGEG